MTHRTLDIAIRPLLAAVLAVAAAGTCRGISATPPAAAPPPVAPPPAAPPAPALSRQAAAAARAFSNAAMAEVRFPGGRAIAAVIADTPERIMYGYMFRPEVREDEGMLFIFPSPGVHGFWMKNTLVPLDIIWMDGNRAIVHIEEAAPPCRADPCPGYGPMRVVSSVLEVRAGTAVREGLKRGDRLSIVLPGEPGVAR